MATIKQTMKRFGFTESETSAYLTLLEGGNLSGYEISKRSGIARSKIYNILETLVNKGIVIVNKTEPKLYQGLSAEEFIQNLEHHVKNEIADLNHHLTNIKEHGEEDDLLWKVSGYINIQSKAKHLIDQAQSSLYIQIWQHELTKELIGSLRLAEERVDHFVLILFKEDEDFTLPLNKYYNHGFEEEKLKDFGHRWLNITRDKEEVLFGEFDFDAKEVEAIWTKNNAMLRLAKEYIKHDAYTLKIIDQLPEPLHEKYKGDLNQLREIY